MTQTTIAYDPFDPDVQTDPYPAYARLRGEAPVYYVESLDAFAVSRHADVRRVMHDHRTFSSEAMAALVARPGEYSLSALTEEERLEAPDEVPTSIVGTDGDTHARLRTIVNRGFTPRRMAEQAREIRTIAQSFVEPFVAGGGDLQSALAIPFPTAVIASLLGVDVDRREEFRRWSEDMVLAVFEPTTPDQQAEIAKSGRKMGEWLDEVVSQRSGAGGDDLISVLLRAEMEGGALTFEEMRGFVFTLLVAGSITTAYLIGSAVVALAESPSLMERARSRSDDIAKIVEETLRYESPVQLMFRTATTSVEIAGTTIPAGATVLPLIGSANRDETVFTEPDRFDPDRATGEHLGFGHGVHFCLGAALARLEARIAIEELLAGAPRLELAGHVQPMTSLVFRGPTAVPLSLAQPPI
jgi:cytochrome P450